MFLSISSKGEGARDLSYILQKNPGRVYSRPRREAWNKIKRAICGSEVSDTSVAPLLRAFDAFTESGDFQPFLGVLLVLSAEVAAGGGAEAGSKALGEAEKAAKGLLPYLKGTAESLSCFFTAYSDKPGEERSSFVANAEWPECHFWNTDTPKADAYVSSRDYALSSLFCRELKDALRIAISGKYKTDEEKAKAARPLDLIVDALPFATSLTDEQLIGLVRPLGYGPFCPPDFETDKVRQYGQQTFLVDHSYQHPWMPGKHRALELTLTCRKTVREVLRQLLVLIPVIDNYTHYDDYDTLVAELKAHGEGWLDAHPMKDFIVARFLRHSKRLITAFEGEQQEQEGESALEKRILLQDMRTEWFVSYAKALNLRKVVDAGCGNGRLAEAVSAAGVLEVSAFDCHQKAVWAAKKRLENKAQVFFSSLMYRDDRLVGKDAILLQEVVEHMPPWQLRRAMELIFNVYRPKWVLMTTPNRSYNKVWGIPDGTFRHRDHKFEFDEAEAKAFCDSLPGGYSYRIEPIGQDYVPPTPEETAKINERLGRPLVKYDAASAQRAAQEGGVATAEPSKVHTDVAPTFGLVFERKDQ